MSADRESPACRVFASCQFFCLHHAPNADCDPARRHPLDFMAFLRQTTMCMQTMVNVLSIKKPTGPPPAARQVNVVR